MVVLLRFYSTEVMSCNALESINHNEGECRSGSMSVPTEDTHRSEGRSYRNIDNVMNLIGCQQHVIRSGGLIFKVKFGFGLITSLTYHSSVVDV